LFLFLVLFLGFYFYEPLITVVIIVQVAL
jgi:hypothetical protein